MGWQKKIIILRLYTMDVMDDGFKGSDTNNSYARQEIFLVLCCEKKRKLFC